MTDRTKRMEALARLAAPGSGATDPERDTARKILERMRTEDGVRVPADFRDRIHLVVEAGSIGFDSFHFHYTENPWPWTGFDPAANVKVGVCGQDVMDAYFPSVVFDLTDTPFRGYDPKQDCTPLRVARLWDMAARYTPLAVNGTRIVAQCPDCPCMVSFIVTDEVRELIPESWVPLKEAGLMRHFARLACAHCREEAEKERREGSNG
jgi:hypothetical protein